MTPAPSNLLLAVSTLIAALFVAVQAWYARVAFVEASETRLLEKKLDVCFENFDAAVRLDGALRALSPGGGIDETWPPQVSVMSARDLERIQLQVVPLLNGLESSLAKASILGPLDRFRTFLSEEAMGLSQRLISVSPTRLGDAEADEELSDILSTLSEFLGAQYSVFEGCRLVTTGEV